MRPAWSVCAVVAAGVTVVAFAGCANIWGFQDGIERVDATTEDGSGSLTPQPDANDGAASDDSGDAEPGQLVTDAAPDAGGDAADAVAVLQDANSDDAEADGQAIVADASSVCDASCAPAPPAGWTGPYALYEAMSAPPPGPAVCPGAYSATIDNGLEGLDAGLAQCTCACGAVYGASCGTPVVDLWSDTNCTSSCSQPSQPIATTCTRPNFGFNCGGGVRFTLEAGAPSGGICAPDGGTTLPPPVWPMSALLCGLPPTVTPSECGGGELCVPSPDPSGALCILQTGASACPSGAYTVPHTYYKSFSDGRTCTPCTCGSPAGVSCSTTVTAYGNANCTGGATRETAPMGCSGDHIASAIAAASTPGGGSCAPVGGQPAGTVTPTGGRTVCCTK